MASGLQNIETVESPFRKFVTTIGVFPTAFTDAMTYYECLAYLVKYMEETLIPAINENAEAVEELQTLYIELKTFVDNYFDNLDVQEEINNKLDQMSEDGTLQEIIATYIQANVTWTFDTVSDMKSAENLVNGSYARTLGFHSINDGGGAIYRIDNAGTADERSVIAIGNLNAHLVLDKFVTPEQYGAYGDGVTDDTDAWQDAVDSGKDVKAFEKTYYISTVTVTKNITIDCGNATIKSNANNAFIFTGEVTSTVLQANDYTAYDSDYTITDSTYTGYAFLRGTNNFVPDREYYVGGFPCTFYEGKITHSYPINVTGVSIDLIQPITFTLKNINDIQHTFSADTIHSIRIVYGYGASLENINISKSQTYEDIELYRCMNVEITNIKVYKDVQFSDNVSYIIYCGDSCFCKVKNSNMFSKYWHSFTTSGTTLCWNNIVENCVMGSDFGVACVDHPNALGTTIRDCTVANIGISGMATIENVTIISINDTQKRAMIQIYPVATKEHAKYDISNVKFLPKSDSNGTYVGIWLSHSPYVTGKTYYYSDINIKNCLSTASVSGKCLFTNLPTTSNYILLNSVVDNTNLNIDYIRTGNTSVDISNAYLTIKNCYDITDSNNNLMTIGNNACTFKNLLVQDSRIYRILGTIDNLTLSNLSATQTLQAFSVTTSLMGSNIYRDINNTILTMPTNVNIANLWRGTGNVVFNINKKSGSVYGLSVNTSTGNYESSIIS